MSLQCDYLPATGDAEQELVLLHGWGSSREVWRPLLARLRPWANVTLPNIPGCAIDSTSCAVPELNDVLAEILQCSPPHAVFVGWSLGGQLALELARLEPERVDAVVTICNNPQFVASEAWPGVSADIFRVFREGMAINPSATLRRFHSLQVGGASSPRQLLRQLQIPGDVAADALLAGLGWLEALDQRGPVLTLRQPQLHLLAEQDALVPAAVGLNLAACMAGALSGQVVMLPDTCHLAPLDSPAALEHHIHQFLPSMGSLQRLEHALPQLQKKDVAASFSRAATAYDSSAQLQREVGEQLLTFLDRYQEAPGIVLDLGCGTGHFCAELKNHFPQAQYLGLDLAAGMVEYARSRCDEACYWMVADAEALPLASESVDVVFSSLAVQWCYRPEHLFAELSRVLRPGGLCVFTSLGPDTLCELRNAWATVDSHQHVNTFLPTADLVAAAERVPAIDMTLQRSAFRMEYERVRELLDELKALGAHNMNRSRPAGLTSRRSLQGMLQAYECVRANGLLPATYDVIFGVLEKT